MASTRRYPQDQAAAWYVAIGSARGAAHRVSGAPNQDSVAQQAIGGPGGAVVVAVADGHGHARHFRSATGSALAVQVACRSATQLATDLSGRARDNEVTEAALDDLVQAIVSGWRAEVGKRLEAEPYTAREQSALRDTGDGPEIPYGTTLILAMVTESWLVCAQIGDGDLLAIQPDGRSFYPLAGDSRLDGQRTTSLCQPDAVASFRTSAHDLGAIPLLALLLATDGYGNAQAAEVWQPGVGQDLARFAGEHDPHWFVQQVPSWAERCASADGSGDDATIALLLQPGAARPPASTRSAAPTIPAAAPTVPAGQTVLAGPTVPAGQTVPAGPTVPASPTHPAEASARVQARAGSSVPAASAGWHGSHRRLAGIAVTTVAAAVLAAVMTVVFTQHPAARTDNPARTGRPVTVQSTPARNARAPIPANSASGPSRAAPSRPRARDRHHLAEEGSMTWTG